MPSPTVELHRSPAASAFLSTFLFLLLSGCSDVMPVSPTSDASGVSLMAENAVGGKVAIKVAHTVRLLPDGNVELAVRAVCPKGYVREESGLLRLEQGLASGEGEVRLHLGGCTGRWQSGNTLVFTFDTPFHRGRARVTATFAVVNPNDPTGMDQLQASVDQKVKIR